ncbi:hypothetical protein [Streptomyces mirabilis]|uniref:hypothetical protein n=1 Tax=Streptomyces mirabilis TaxID=68239 RepID=UPI0033F0C410
MPLLDKFAAGRKPRINFLELDHQRRAMAFHEAGHAVLGMLAGMRCNHTGLLSYLTPSPSGASMATAWTGLTNWAPYHASFFDIAVAHGEAGRVAETRYLSQSGLLTALSAPDARHDRLSAAALLADVGYQIVDMGEPAPASGTTWEAVTIAAERRCEEEWERITAVVDAIMAASYHTVSGDLAAAAAGIPNPPRARIAE